jgi:hypothetical protein
LPSSKWRGDGALAGEGRRADGTTARLASGALSIGALACDQTLMTRWHDHIAVADCCYRHDFM